MTEEQKQNWTFRGYVFVLSAALIVGGGWLLHTVLAPLGNFPK